MANRYMRYEEVKGIRVKLTPEEREKEIVLDETWEYVRIEGMSVAVYINNAEEEDYVFVNGTLELSEIGVKKIKVKTLEVCADENNVQIILMK